MAATDANTALNELMKYISPLTPAEPTLTPNRTLDMAKVPDKLHCPGCHNFLANAFKTPCCDQAICEICKLPSMRILQAGVDPSQVNLLFKTNARCAIIHL
jgi:hypothetical protein